MGPPLSFEAKNLLRLLADGEWHNLEDVKRRLAATVGPGKALRRYEIRQVDRVEREGPRRAAELAEPDKIASGQRIIAGVALHSMRKKYVEVEDAPEGRLIRIRPDMLTVLGLRTETAGEEDTEPARDEPGRLAPPSAERGTDPTNCHVCGMYVANEAQHGEWHRLQEEKVIELAVHRDNDGAPAAVAFFSEDQVRDIIREVVGEELDAFQKGMQNWMIHRFSAVEALVQDTPRGGPRHADRAVAKRRW